MWGWEVGGVKTCIKRVQVLSKGGSVCFSVGSWIVSQKCPRFFKSMLGVHSAAFMFKFVLILHFGIINLILDCATNGWVRASLGIGKPSVLPLRKYIKYIKDFEFGCLYSLTRYGGGYTKLNVVSNCRNPHSDHHQKCTTPCKLGSLAAVQWRSSTTGWHCRFGVCGTSVPVSNANVQK